MKKSTIVDNYYLPGFPKQLFDTSTVQSVPIAWTVVVNKMFKKGYGTYIELKDPLNVGEVVEMGHSKTTYKILKMEKVTTTGRIYKIAKTDGTAIAEFHYDDVEVKSKARITNRRSFQQQLSLIFD